MKPAAALALTALFLASAGTAPVAGAVTPAKASKTQSAEINGLEPIAVSDSYISDQTTTFTNKSSKIFQFDLKGKWGLKFDVNQADSRPSGFNDVDAGAFYKLSPSLRVGGTVGFGEKTEAFKPEQTPSRVRDDKAHPRVRLETTFKF